MLALFAGAATHHAPAGPRGQDSGPQDTPPPMPTIPSCPCPGPPAASPPGLPPSPPCRRDDVAAESDSVEVTNASARPPPIAFPWERPRWAGGVQGRLPTPTQPGTHPTHSAHPAANHHPLTPLPPAPPLAGKIVTSHGQHAAPLPLGRRDGLEGHGNAPLFRLIAPPPCLTLLTQHHPYTPYTPSRRMHAAPCTA